MFIEQVIEIKFKGPGPLVVHVILKLVIFMPKRKISKENKFLSEL